MYGHNLQDLTGQRFGILTVLEYARRKHIPCGQAQTLWRCRCDCGSIVEVRAATLKNGDTRSCGCVKSHGERLVAEAFNANNIRYLREYTFEDCVNHKGNPCRFDFAIIQDGNVKALVEYQGEQHYAPPTNTPWFGQMQRSETDQIKRDYCLTHNILFYEIRYDEDIDARVSEIITSLHDNTVPSADDSAKV